MNQNSKRSHSSVTDIEVKDSSYDWVIKKYGPIYRCLSAEYKFITSSLFKFDIDSEVDWRLGLEFKEGDVDLIYAILKKGSLRSKNITAILSVLNSNQKVLVTFKKELGNDMLTGNVAITLPINNKILQSGKESPSPNDTLIVRFNVVYHNLITNPINPAKKPKSDPLEKLFQDKKFCDTKIIVGDRSFDAHKCVLSSRSAYFSVMFESDMKENRQNEVEVSDVSWEVVQEVLRFIYTNEVNNLDILKTDLFVAADKYMIEDLKVLCEEALANDLKIENFVDSLILADRYDLNDLKVAASNFFVIHKKEIMISDELKSVMKNLPASALFNLIEQ